VSLLDLLDPFDLVHENSYDKARREGRRPPGRDVWVDIHGNNHNVYSRDPVPPCSYRECHCKRKRT